MKYTKMTLIQLYFLVAIIGSMAGETVIKNETNGDIEITGSVDMSLAGARATVNQNQMIKKIGSGSQITFDSCYTISVNVKALTGSAAGQTCSFLNSYFIYPNQDCPCDAQVRIYVSAATNTLKADVTHFKNCSSGQ